MLIELSLYRRNLGQTKFLINVSSKLTSHIILDKQTTHGPAWLINYKNIFKKSMGSKKLNT